MGTEQTVCGNSGAQGIQCATLKSPSCHKTVQPVLCSPVKVSPLSWQEEKAMFTTAMASGQACLLRNPLPEFPVSLSVICRGRSPDADAGLFS